MLRVDEIDPTEDTARWLTDLEARRRVARLPPEYREIVSAEAITRGQLAAMIGVRFETLRRRRLGRGPVFPIWRQTISSIPQRPKPWQPGYYRRSSRTRFDRADR